MKLEYKYFYFKLFDSGGKLPVYVCYSKKESYLGTVKWYSAWRQYCFFPAQDTVFSRGCLIDINDFMNQLEELRIEDKARKMILARAKKVVF